MSNLWITAQANMTSTRLRTTQYNAVQKLLTDLLALKQIGNTTAGVSIVGDTGSGKSTAVQRFVSSNPPVQQATRTYVPVIYVEVSASPTLNDFCESILRAYGDFYAKGRLSDLRQRVRELIIACGTLLIVIDEAQHFVDRGKKKTHERTADFIKLLMNADTRLNGNYPGVSIALVGLPRTQELLQVNKQLLRRVTAGHLCMSGFHVADKAARVEFFNLMVSLMQTAGGIDIEQYKALLAAGDLLEALYYATDGRIAYMSSISAAAVKSALEADRQNITRDDLQQGFFAVTGFLPKPEDNPFNSAFVRRRLGGFGEPFGEAA